jgi:glycosyltransferase involved in cell wall biosynthesis
MVDVIAMSDKSGYIYPECVKFEIREGERADYRSAAEFINRNGYDLLSVQHEYGIFGGKSGIYLMDLVREAKMPIVTTLHTVLQEPSVEQKAVLDELLQLSERVVVMSQKAVEFLTDVHEVPLNKIDLIHHGIPSVSQTSASSFRASLGIVGPMILTFGLLSPDKGIQYVIEAMPAIVQEQPGAIYLVVGATHPKVKASAGESYRESLIKLADDLGVGKNVRFVDRFVEAEELVEYLGAMDIYVTPYLNAKQITSGTLAYSVGAGKAVISTPYWYAQELLADGRGVLVPFRDADAISDAVLALQNDPDSKVEIGRKAAAFGKQMLWPEVGLRYVESFEHARKDSQDRLRSLIQKPFSGVRSHRDMPELRLTHLFDLSDDTGILQHATYTIPNRVEGYCVDDNARALLFTASLEARGPISPEIALIQSRYLSFLLNAYNPDNGRFRNFMSYSREWLETEGSEDSHGRSLWGLGSMVNHCRDRGRRDVAKQLFGISAPALYKTRSLRTWAYGVIALEEYLLGSPNEPLMNSLMEAMASRIWSQLEFHHSPDWPWFEQVLTYANARIPQALIIAGERLQNIEMLQTGLKSLSWLMQIQTSVGGQFAPIGSDGFFVRGGDRSFFDQQPVEASGSVSACLCAYRITGNSFWLSEAYRSFHWFLGENMLGQSLYDPLTGGCHDGLHEVRVNRNQGAESTLSFLCSLTEIQSATANPILLSRNS